MKRTARRLVALIGAAVLLVLALAAGPAAAAMMIQTGRGTGFVTVSTPPPSNASPFLIALLSAVAIALIAGVSLAAERRSNRLAAAEGPAEAPAENAGQVCDDVVCEWPVSRRDVQERKAA
jgi:hypothetical protein